MTTDPTVLSSAMCHCVAKSRQSFHDCVERHECRYQFTVTHSSHKMSAPGEQACNDTGNVGNTGRDCAAEQAIRYTCTLCAADLRLVISLHICCQTRLQNRCVTQCVHKVHHDMSLHSSTHPHRLNMMVESEGSLPKCGHLAVLNVKNAKLHQAIHTYVPCGDGKGRQLMYHPHKIGRTGNDMSIEENSKMSPL